MVTYAAIIVESGACLGKVRALLEKSLVCSQNCRVLPIADQECHHRALEVVDELDVLFDFGYLVATFSKGQLGRVGIFGGFRSIVTHFHVGAARRELRLLGRFFAVLVGHTAESGLRGELGRTVAGDSMIERYI